MTLGQENSSLGAPLALVRIFGIQQTISLVFIPKILTNTKFPPQILELDSSKSNESSLRDSLANPANKRSEFSWQSNQNKYARSANPLKSFCYFWLSPKVESLSTSSLRGRIVDSHEAIQKIAQPNLARFVVQKIGIKDAVVPSADFLLESDKRGTPPKSEKRQLLARRGSGAGGAALLRKKTSESKSKKIVGDSQIAKIDCFGQSPRNDESSTNYFDSPLQNLAITNRFHNPPQRLSRAF